MTLIQVARRCRCCGSAVVKLRGASDSTSHMLCGECGEHLGAVPDGVPGALEPGTTIGAAAGRGSWRDADPLRILT